MQRQEIEFLLMIQMKPVMIHSANDTAYLMAESVAGIVDEFVKMMNEKSSGFRDLKTHNIP